jgi:hypothetical protein
MASLVDFGLFGLGAALLLPSKGGAMTLPSRLRSADPTRATRHTPRMELFWTIMVYVFVFGMAALGGFVGFYWFVVVGQREASTRRAPVGRG